MPLLERALPLIGEDGIKKLGNAHVAVFGLGGVGSWCAEALVRTGIGNITVIDHDTVSDSNRNRQLIALSSDIGVKKVDAQGTRLRDISPECKVTQLDIFFSAETSKLIDFSRFDYIADCIDTVTSKLFLIKTAKDMNIPIISSMGTGNRTDPSLISVKDIYETAGCPLARVMRKELRARGIGSLKVICSDEPPKECISGRETETNKATPSSICFVPATAGIRMAYEIVTEILK